MKRIIALVCAFVILSGFFLNTSVSANDYIYADEEKYDVDAYHSEIWERYEILGDRLWIAQSTDEFYSFVNLVNATYDDAWLEFGVNLAEEELTKMRYVEILVNLMALMDVNTKEMIENQAKADTLKTLNDYFLDATEILVEGISVSAAFGIGVTAPMKSIASTMDLTWDAAEVTINSIEVLEYVNRVQKNYVAYTSFLAAVAENADNSTLRSAADTLSAIAGKAFYCKVDAVISQSDATSEYLGKEVFFDTLLLEDMLEDASIFKLSSEDMAIIEQFKMVYDSLGVLEFSQDVAVFISDIVGGFSDCMNRYSEMRALYEIRKALLSEIGQLRAKINDANDAETIGSVCDLLRCVLYVNFRGEYCFHEMVTTDGDLFSIAITKNGKETSYDELYEFRKEKTVQYSYWLDILIPDIELYGLTDENQGNTSDSYLSAIYDIYFPFCQTLPDVYTSSQGDTADKRSCLIVDFEENVPNLVVRYWNTDATSPKEFYEVWMIYGIENGKIVELFRDENYSITRRDIHIVYDGNYRFALREEQTGGYYMLIVQYPQNVLDTSVYENYKYVQMADASNILRVWNISGEYIDIEINKKEGSNEELIDAVYSKTDLAQYLNTNIFDFVDMIGDMHNVGATDGSTEFSNGTIIVSAGYDSNKIQFISIDSECKFSIKGIEYGMSISDATEIAAESCSHISRDLPHFKIFILKDGTSLYIYAEDEATVNGISLFSNQ